MTKGIGNNLYLAPLEKNKLRRILDIGTGTGVCMSTMISDPSRLNQLTVIGAVSMGDKFPDAEA